MKRRTEYIVDVTSNSFIICSKSKNILLKFLSAIFEFLPKLVPSIECEYYIVSFFPNVPVCVNKSKCKIWQIYLENTCILQFANSFGRASLFSRNLVCVCQFDSKQMNGKRSVCTPYNVKFFKSKSRKVTNSNAETTVNLKNVFWPVLNLNKWRGWVHFCNLNLRKWPFFATIVTIAAAHRSLIVE